MEELAIAGNFSPQALRTLETSLERGILLNKGRVFADLWDTVAFPSCQVCREQRIARLHAMNLEQQIFGAIVCDLCNDEA
jgi:hypothetical protein